MTSITAEIGGSGLLNPDEALRIILDSVPLLETERVRILDALGRTLAQDLYAPEDLPPFDNSAMDGYAVSADDTMGASAESPKVLLIMANEPAGTVLRDPILPRTAVRIMTGAPIPTGANAVVPVEDTGSIDQSTIISKHIEVGTNIRFAGEDVRRGELVIEKGTRIGPAEMGMLAALGLTQVEVYRKPRVSILTTGSEIVDPSQQPGPGQIRDSNSFSLAGQIISVGAEIALLERVADERDELKDAIKRAAGISDVVITSGGVSVGDYDLVKSTLASLGDVHFWKVAIKPGKPLAYGNVLERPLFGLPGNPVSSMVTFDLFVKPALMKMSGAREILPTRLSGRMKHDIRHKEGRREFVRAVTVWNKNGYTAASTGNQGSARLSSMIGANSYVVIPESRGNVKAGDRVDIMLME